MDYSKADMEPRKDCEALGKFKSKEIVQITAVMMPAEPKRLPTVASPVCSSPEIAFEVSLPAKWNGRFYMIGNGGYAGEAMDDPGRVAQRNEALQLGFAFAQTNTGHDARKEPGASFVMSNPQKAIDYAYRAVHLTAKTTKEITKEYYGKSVSRAYWNSCSNGGRQGLIEAQRFPDDFDGIVANFAVGGSDRLHRWRDVESESAQRGAAYAGQAGAGGRQGDGEVRCDRRS